MQKHNKMLYFSAVIILFFYVNVFSQSEPDPFAVDNNRVSASDLLSQMDDPNATPKPTAAVTPGAAPASQADTNAQLDSLMSDNGDILAPDTPVLNEAMSATPVPSSDIKAAMSESSQGATQEQASSGITAVSEQPTETPTPAESEEMYKSPEVVIKEKEMTREQMQKDVKDLFAEGKKYYDVEDYEGAAEIWERILVNYPTATGLYNIRYSIANAYEFTRQYDRAIMNYQKVLAEKPKDEISIESAYRLAGCYVKLEKWPYAMEIYKDIVRKQGRSSEKGLRAYFNMAMLYLKKENFKRAETIYKNIIAYYPNTSSEIQARFALASMYAQNHKYKSAVNEYKILKSKYKDTEWAPMAALHIGDTYKLSGDIRTAKEEYSKVIYEYYNRETYVRQAEDRIEGLKNYRAIENKVYGTTEE
jgi:TolA-binding protein